MPSLASHFTACYLLGPPPPSAPVPAPQHLGEVEKFYDLLPDQSGTPQGRRPAGCSSPCPCGLHWASNSVKTSKGVGPQPRPFIRNWSFNLDLEISQGPSSSCQPNEDSQEGPTGPGQETLTLDRLGGGKWKRAQMCAGDHPLPTGHSFHLSHPSPSPVPWGQYGLRNTSPAQTAAL